MFDSLIFKYICVGALATACDMFLFGLLLHYGALHYAVALCSSFIVGVFINFLGCDLFIFQRTQPFWQACLKHYGVSLTGLLLNQVGLFITVLWYDQGNLIIARLVIATFTCMINFLIIKKFVFSQHTTT